MSDPIGDLLTRIRNAGMAERQDVHIPHSRLKENLCHLLAQRGFIEKVSVSRSGKFPVIRVVLSQGGAPQLRRVSRPGRRVYRAAKDMHRVRGGMGLAIVSTSSGLMSDADARKRHVGGEVLCEVF